VRAFAMACKTNGKNCHIRRWAYGSSVNAPSPAPFCAQVYVAPRGWLTVGAFPTRAAAARRAAQAFVRPIDGQAVSQVRVVRCRA